MIRQARICGMPIKYCCNNMWDFFNPKSIDTKTVLLASFWFFIVNFSQIMPAVLVFLLNSEVES